MVQRRQVPAATYRVRILQPRRGDLKVIYEPPLLEKGPSNGDEVPELGTELGTSLPPLDDSNRTRIVGHFCLLESSNAGKVPQSPIGFEFSN